MSRSTPSALVWILLLGGAPAPAEPVEPAVEVAEPAWELRRDEDGIAVYTRPVARSTLLACRGVTRLRTSLHALVALALDVERIPAWIDRTSESRLLGVRGPAEGWTYTVTRLPWPLQDRDTVTHWWITQDETGVVTSWMENAPDYLPLRRGRVRLQRSSGFWRFAQVGLGEVEVTFQAHNDPAGRIPERLVNALVVGIPYNTLRGMRRELEKRSAELAGVRFDFIREPPVEAKLAGEPQP